MARRITHIVYQDPLSDVQELDMSGETSTSFGMHPATQGRL
jgi:hypothetical protein